MPGPDPAAARLAALTPRERTRLAGILSRLSSPFESERAAAGLLATAFIEKHGLAWADLTSLPRPAPAAPVPAPPPPPARADATPGAPPLGQVERRGTGKAWRGYCRRRLTRLGQALSRTT